MFIEQLILENFQSHEHSIFKFDKNLNIIVGVSNAGKSSVSRALAAVLFCQFDKSWVRHGAKYCRVTITTNTGIEVVREKGDTINRYSLKIQGGPDQPFESVGTTVPEPIQQALKIHTVQVDTKVTLNLNLAGQMDSLFLLTETGSYRANVLGKLSGATHLDHAIRELNKEKREITRDKNTQDTQIVELQGQVDKLVKINAYSLQISALEDALSSLACSQERVERIRNLLERVKASKDTWTRENKKLELLGPIVADLTISLHVKVDKIKTISLLWSKIVNFKRTYEQQNKLNDLLTPVDLSAILLLANKVANLKGSNDLSIKVAKNTKELLTKIDEVRQVEQRYKEAVQQYGDMLKAAGVCPMCNRSTVECIQ